VIRTTLFFVLFLLRILVFVTAWLFCTFIIIRFWLKTTHSSSLPSAVVATETISFCVSHLIGIVFLEEIFFSIIIQKFILILFLLLTLELFDPFILLQSSFLIFAVVFVEFIFKIIDICKLLNINSIETFQLKLKSLVFLLILWLDILDTFKSFLGPLEFLLSSLEFVLEFSLVESELLDRFFHVFHLCTLTVNDILDCSLQVDLLGV
jgi:hypothetical protein